MTGPAASNAIVIVGAGVAGLTLALTLARNGLPFLIVEQSATLPGAGAGFLLAPNATRVLAKLGVLESVIAAGRVTTRWSLLDHRGLPLRELLMPPGGPPALSIHRAGLLQALASNLPSDALQFGTTVADLRPNSVLLSGGESLPATVIVGADGVHSLVRRSLFGSRPLRYRGYVGWRGIAPFVPDRYEQGLLSEAWGRGARFGIAPIDSARTYWYASANRPESWEDPVQGRQARLLDLFGGWHAPVAALVERTPNDAILVNRIYDGPRLRHWSKGNTVLIGDAAHAMTPNLGQGACLAIEDAWTLGALLSSGLDPRTAIARYEHARTDRVHAIQLQSRTMGWVVQAESPWAMAARRWMTPRLPQYFTTRAMRQLFDYDFV